MSGREREATGLRPGARSGLSTLAVKRALAQAVLLSSLLIVASRWFTSGDFISVVATVVVFGLSALLWAANPSFARPLRLFALIYGLFLVWAWLSLLWAGLSAFALQNLMMFSTFYFLCLVYSDSDLRLRSELYRGIVLVSVLAIVSFRSRIVFFGVSDGGWPIFRPLALFLTVPLAWTAAKASLGRGYERLWSALLSVVILVAIGSTGSRTATIIAVVLCLLACASGSDGRLRLTRVAAGVVIGAAVVAAVFSALPRFSERPGIDVVDTGAADINVSGRLYRWIATLDSWGESVESQIVGKGVGSVAEPMKSWPGPHPLNEYLRLLHDYGPVGLGLWTLSLLSILVPALLRAVQRPRAVSKDDMISRLTIINSAALLLMACMFLIPLVYLFVMAPLAMMIGVMSADMDQRQESV